MKTLKNIFAAGFIFAVLVSCGNKQVDNSHPINPETPKALQEGSFEIKRYTGSRDLTEELYQELVEKTPALKKLEQELDAFSAKPNELKDKFNQYEHQSTGYYNSANNKALSISDSLLRKKISLLIEQSSKRYTSQTDELNTLLKQISKNGISLNDHHTVLKIVVTLPIIETYQNENKPDKKEFQNVIKEQENLIIRTDSLIPKY